jgi:hypothetical protein
MQDRIFANQAALSTESYERWGGSSVSISTDLTPCSRKGSWPSASPSIPRWVPERRGRDPTFFDSGERVLGAVPVEQRKIVSDRQLDRSAHR